MIAWKSLQLLLLCAILAAWSNAQAQEAKTKWQSAAAGVLPGEPERRLEGEESGD
jgi:hypothetical protein